MIKSYVGPLVMTFFIAMFILLMQFLWKYIDDLVGKGLEWYIIAELLFYASSTFVPMALPLAILLSSIMCFGNLGEHYELVAMKSAGISLRKIMKPLVILSFILSLFAFYFSNNVLPYTNLKFKSLLYDVRKKKLAVNIKEGVFYNDMEDYVIKVGRKDSDGKTVYDVKIWDHTGKKGNTSVTIADSGIMEPTGDGQYLVFSLFNGYNYEENTDQKDYRLTRPLQRTVFQEQIRIFDLSEFSLRRTDEELFKNNYQMLNIEQLNFSIDSLNSTLEVRKSNLAENFIRNFRFYLAQLNADASYDTLEVSPSVLPDFERNRKMRIVGEALGAARNLSKTVGYYGNEYEDKQLYINKHKVVWHQKFTLSFACLVLFFIGAPLGAIIRKGGLGLPVVVSVLFFVMYHIISMIGEKSAKQGAMDVAAGMWLSSFILLPLGIFLTYKATSDAPIMDREIWNKIFDKVNILKKLLKKRERGAS